MSSSLTQALKAIALLPRFLPIYLWEMTKSNLKVALDTLRPRPQFAPRFVDLDLGGYNEVQRYGAACLITMTPGTLSVEMTDSDYLTVHCLYSDDPNTSRTELMKLVAQAFGRPDSRHTRS